MNLGSTTPVIKRFATSSTLVAIAVVMTFSSSLPVYADEYDDKIRKIQGQVNEYKAQANKLNLESNNLQAAINGLEAQINGVQAKIDLSQTKHDQLVQQIKDTEAKIIRNQEVLGETIGNLYVSSKVTPVEMLASSKNIGDYLDQQEFRSSVRDQVEDAIKEIKTLKKSLEEKEVAAKNVLDQQKGEQADLASKKKEQADLLEATRGNEAVYNSLVGTSLAEIQSYRDAQNAAYARASAAWSGGYISVGGSGGYPYAGTGLTKGGCGSCIDEFRLYKGQCVSYVAWRLASEGYKVYPFDGMGDASDWPSTTTSYWASKYGAGNAAQRRSEPRAGYAAINPSIASPYGHVMYIEQDNGNGTIRVSEYNFTSPDTYSQRNVPTSGLIFLEFARQ